MDNSELVDIMYFMEHGSDKVKQTVAELTTARYEASKHWSEKFHIPLLLSDKFIIIQ